MYKRHTLIVAAIASASVTAASAAERTAPLVVTATRTPVTADDALAAVSVITRDDIDRRQPADVPELLRSLPGVSLARNGGRGKTASLYLRGTESDHTLVLIDGVRIGSATLGSAPLEQLPVGEIQRIEVVRGPRASLYGADAIGGVIQIFTRRDRSHARLAVGNRDTWEFGAGLAREGERGGFAVSASGQSTDGFDATDERSFSHDPDRDGYDSRSGNVTGHYQVTDTLTLRGRALRVDGENEFDSTSTAADETQQVVSGEAEWQPAQSWRSRLSVGSTLDDLDSRDFGGDRFVTRRDTATWQNDFFIGDDHVTTAGVDYHEDRVSGTIDYTETHRDNLAVFVQHQWYAGAFDVQGALRHDDNEAFGGETTGNIAVGYRISPALRTYASYGTAFKAPTFNDLYYPDTGFFKGNPNLEPEHSRTTEVGLESSGAWQWRVAAFHTDADDLITFDANAASSVNVNEARIRGIEGEVSGNIAGFGTRLAATWLDAEDGDTGNDLPRRPDLTATLGIDRAFGPARVGTEIHYGGERFDELANTTELDSFTVVDVTASYALSDVWTLRGKVANLLDEDYQTADTFEMPGRTVLVSIEWRGE